MIKKILIANRGEIACRIIKTAQKMGIATVAIYSDVDAQAPHVVSADEAYEIGPALAQESYLNIEKIEEIIALSGADSVHPGYGFLSESHLFAQRLKQKGIVFIGPSSKAIRLMGDKIESKRIAQEASVNMVPGYPEAIANVEEGIRIANDIGYPVMVKAAAGGGGKGMRLVRSPDEFVTSFSAAINEATNAFGDGRVFIEKFIENPRHIEIQILADNHANTLYIGERECSLQRRHQKILEESPSAFISDKTRQMMGKQAVMLAQAVDYKSAGTVEFIVDQEGHFYFLEMNTRLQVEHPVTELVSGIDLVEWMIKIACNEKLDFTQSQIKQNGWALEARIYAEDPTRGFLPSIGRIHKLRTPKETNNDEQAPIIRIDTGIVEGNTVSMYYDPMLAKLVVWANTRNEAFMAMRHALNQFLIEGVGSNLAFLLMLACDKNVLAGNADTGYIERIFPDGLTQDFTKPCDMAPFLAVGVLAWLERMEQDFDKNLKTSCFDLVVFSPDKESFSVRYTSNKEMYIDDVEISIKLIQAEIPGVMHMMYNNLEEFFQVKWHGEYIHVSYNGQHLDLLVMPSDIAAYFIAMPIKEPADMSCYLLSPMPGTLVKLMVQEGDIVEVGQNLAIIEAMKMENILCATHQGKVANIIVKSGETVQSDQVIIEFESSK